MEESFIRNRVEEWKRKEVFIHQRREMEWNISSLHKCPFHRCTKYNVIRWNIFLLFYPLYSFHSSSLLLPLLPSNVNVYSLILRIQISPFLLSRIVYTRCIFDSFSIHPIIFNTPSIFQSLPFKEITLLI